MIKLGFLGDARFTQKLAKLHLGGNYLIVTIIIYYNI